jgi:hypothetical protein
MSDITNIDPNSLYIVGKESWFNEDVRFFKDVYIYGQIKTESETIEFENLSVSGNSDFYGTSSFYGDVFIYQDGTLNVGLVTIRRNLDVFGDAYFGNNVFIENNLDVGILTVRREFDVGVGGSVFTAYADGPSYGRVGVNSINPEQSLDVIGNLKLSNQLYDSTNSPGVFGSYLTKDDTGVKWVLIPPAFSEGINVYNDEVLIGIQSFRGINFKTGRGAGINTDPVQAFVNPRNPFIADIFVYDYWDYSSSGIYRFSNVGINNASPAASLDVSGNVNITSTLNVNDATTLNNTLTVAGNTILNASTQSNNKDTGALVVSNGGLGVEGNVNIGGYADILSTLDVDGATTLNNTLDVDGDVTFNSITQSTDKDTGALVVTNGGLGVEGNTTIGGNVSILGQLTVDQESVFNDTVELNSSLIDVNNSTASDKFDYRLSSVGTGVSWRPPGVQTQNAIWVTMDGNDSNTGYLEGDAKRTIGAAASVAQEGDTIFVRSGVYYENNPIGLRTDVSISGQDLRLVTIIPINTNKDVFHVRRGCLIENVNFSGTSVLVNHSGCGAVAFPPTSPENYANTGYIAPGPATEGSTGRWRSPYVRNCTNFMTGSIGMKINGDHATASTIGNDLKCMVCDSFTQYNENGIGVSITNNGYAQLVSIFTINCNIAIYCDSGGSCDLTNSNSSFGNFGLVAVGLGATEFTGQVFKYPSTRITQGVDAGSDIVTFKNVADLVKNPRRPYDGQSLFFKIDLSRYPDADTRGLTNTILQEPMRQIQSITLTNGGSGYSAVNPPTIIIRDSSDLTQQPKGPQGIISEVSPTIDEITGEITAIDVINSGRNYLPTQDLEVFIDGTGGASAIVNTQPIYYTIDVATEPTDPIGRYADAVSLIFKNIDFIATEAVDRMLYYYNVTLGTPFSVPGGSFKCVSDVKLVLGAVAHNLQFGGNDRVYDAAKVYVDNPYLAGEESQSIVTFNYARDIAKQIINNVTVSKQNYTGINVYNQVKDLTLVADPSPSSGSPSNTNPNSCTNVRNAIDTFFAIITTAVNPASSPRLPTSRTIGNTVGITTVTFNEFIPYELFGDEEVTMRRISRILTSSHSFEYVGTGTDINNSTPFKGAIPIKSNEVVALDGAQVPFTSSDQKGNFDIGEGFQVNNPTGTIRGRNFSKAIQAEITPLVIALR